MACDRAAAKYRQAKWLSRGHRTAAHSPRGVQLELEPEGKRHISGVIAP
jgi:hypothetical protein